MAGRARGQRPTTTGRSEEGRVCSSVVYESSQKRRQQQQGGEAVRVGPEGARGASYVMYTNETVHALYKTRATRPKEWSA